MKILVASANGYGNAGDDICAVVAEDIANQTVEDAEVKVTAPPFDAELAAWADVIMLGGGGIIYDANPANMENYLAYVDYGIKHKKITVGLGLGEQGIVSTAGEKRYKKAFNKMSLLTVRSQKDATRLKQFGTTTAQATQDLAFSFDYSQYRRLARKNRLIRSINPLQKKKKLGIVLSNQEHLVTDLKLAFSKQEKVNALNFKNAFEANISKISERFDVTLITQSRDDLEMAENYQKKYGIEVYSYRKASDMDDLLKVYAQQDLILTQRFHGIVFSFMMDVPVVTLGYHGQKQHKLLTDMGLDAKLIPYHQPETLENTIKQLAGGDASLADYRISLTDSHKLFLKQTARLNLQKLTSTLKGEDRSEYPFLDRPWPVRYEIVAGMIPKGYNIIDIGAGEEYITEWIKPKKYYPIDIFPCTDRTTVVDLNKEKMPEIPGKWDLVLTQGVFEYLTTAEQVMKDLHAYSDRMVTTCYFRDTKMKLWARAWTKDSFESALDVAGWEIVECEKVPKLNQYVYSCHAKV